MGDTHKEEQGLAGIGGKHDWVGERVLYLHKIRREQNLLVEKYYSTIATSKRNEMTEKHSEEQTLFLM